MSLKKNLCHVDKLPRKQVKFTEHVILNNDKEKCHFKHVYVFFAVMPGFYRLSCILG